MQLIQDERKAEYVKFFTPFFSVQTCDHWCVIRHHRMSFFDLIYLSLSCINIVFIILGLIFALQTLWNLSKSQFWVTQQKLQQIAV